MKKLIVATMLGLALSFPSLSLASDYMGWLHTKPVVKSEVRSEIKGGDVEKDFISFYISPKEANTATLLRADRKSDDDKDYIVVFGVRIPVSHRGINLNLLEGDEPPIWWLSASYLENQQQNLRYEASVNDQSSTVIAKFMETSK